MDIASFSRVPDGSRDCIRGVQGVVIPETWFKLILERMQVRPCLTPISPFAKLMSGFLDYFPADAENRSADDLRLYVESSLQEP